MSKQNTTKKPSPLSSSLSLKLASAKVKPLSKPSSVDRHRILAFRKTYAPKLAAVIKQLKSTRIINDYVAVAANGKDSKDLTDASEIESLTLQLSLLKTAARAAVGSNHIKTVLYYSGSGSAGAGNVYPSSFGLQPSACGEYSSYATLYDEVRVHAIKVHYVVSSTTANTGEPCFYCFGYDSTYNSTPSSVLDVMESSQHELGAVPVIASSNASTNLPGGVRTFHIRVPRQSVANAASVTGGTGIVPNFPGEWMAAGDTADTVGFLRIFVERCGGTTSIITVSYKIEFLCEWRERT